MPYIAGVLIDVITDVSPNESSTTTDHALEDNSQIADHVKNNPITISLSGYIKDNTESKVLALRKARESGVLFQFDYMTNYGSVLITDFSRDYSASVKDGYAFKMTLKQVKTAKVAKFVPVQSKSIKRQTVTPMKKGYVQPKKSGKSVAAATKKKYKAPLAKSTPNIGWAGLEGRK